MTDVEARTLAQYGTWGLPADHLGIVRWTGELDLLSGAMPFQPAWRAVDQHTVDELTRFRETFASREAAPRRSSTVAGA